MSVYSNSRRLLCILAAVTVLLCSVCFPEPVCAENRNKESLITNVRNPSNGVIKYNVTVPAGERVDYSVTLTPDKKGKAVDVINGSLKNRTRRTVRKTVTANVKYLSNKYKITATYTKEVSGEDISYRDVDTAVSALKQTVVTRKLKWDFSKLGKGNKEWKYRYKYVPFRNGFKKYIEVFNKKGERIKYYVKQRVLLSKITKIIKEMKAR